MRLRSSKPLLALFFLTPVLICVGAALSPARATPPGKGPVPRLVDKEFVGDIFITSYQFDRGVLGFVDFVYLPEQFHQLCYGKEAQECRIAVRQQIDARDVRPKQGDEREVIISGNAYLRTPEQLNAHGEEIALRWGAELRVIAAARLLPRMKALAKRHRAHGSVHESVPIANTTRLRAKLRWILYPNGGSVHAVSVLPR